VRIDIYRRASQLPAGLFAALPPCSPYTRTAELQRLERGHPTSTWYLVAVDADDTASGFVPVYASERIPPECDPVRLFGTTPGTVLLIGAPGGHVNHLTVRQPNPATVAGLLIGAAIRLSREVGADHVVLPQLTAEQHSWLDAVPRVAERTRYTAVLDLPEGEFGDYVAGLPAGRRTKVRRERGRFPPAGWKLLEQPLTGSGADYAELAPLLGAVDRKSTRLNSSH